MTVPLDVGYGGVIDVRPELVLPVSAAEVEVCTVLDGPVIVVEIPDSGLPLGAGITDVERTDPVLEPDIGN